MSDQKIASSGAAIFWEVAMDGNLANADGVEGADRKSATGTPSPAPAILRLPEISGSFFLALNYLRYHYRARSGVSAPTGEKSTWRTASANVDGVEGADTMSATETPSPAPAILLNLYVI